MRQRQFDRQLAPIRKVAALGDVDGSIAAIGTLHTVRLAHGPHEETLPVIAHCEVWSPRPVAAMDRYLESDDAPRFLVRNATYSSASNEPTVARLSRLIFNAEDYTLLERRTEPLVVSSRTLFDVLSAGMSRSTSPVSTGTRSSWPRSASTGT